MASRKKTQRKRKSAGVSDIFEISDKDLSPEPEVPNREPEAKISKAKRDSDVSDSRRNSAKHNLSSESPNISKNSKIITKNSKTIVQDKDLKNDSAENTDKVEPAVEGEPSQEPPLRIADDATPIKNQSVNNVGDDILSIENEDTSLATIFLVESPSINYSKLNVIDISDSDTDKAITVPEPKSTTIEVPSCQVSQVLNDSVICLDDTLEDGEVNEAPQDESDATSPIVTIKFSKKSIADTYKVKFIKFFQSFVELIAKNGDEMTINIFRDDNINPKEWVVLDNTVCVPNEEEELAKLLPPTPLKPESPKKKKKKKKQQLERELFVVDTTPGNDSRTNSVQTKYSTKFSITEELKGNETDALTSGPISGSVCFNCGNEHSLKDCPHPKDYAKINANRQKYQNRSKSSRYHKEDDQKYSHLQPGKISAALRKALLLKENQIPSFIYQMRRLGYPPGWLEDAKYVTSELSMFDIDGNNVKNPNARRNRGLDPEKVVEYPGFNAPMAEEFRDEHKYYRVPPYSDDFSKESMIQVFKKMADREEDDLHSQDMDIDHANEDSTDDVSSREESQDYRQFSESIVLDSDSNAPPCLSLLELENQKNKLLEEIKKSHETLTWDQNSNDNTNPPSVESAKAEGLTGCNKDETAIKDNSNSSQDVKIDSPSTSVVNSVKHSTFGTPILKSASPYATLPNPDNFMVGVSPVIDFENLPNSTGKYKQMTGLLQKVRSTLKGLPKLKL